jgi:hypothetical protein
MAGEHSASGTAMDAGNSGFGFQALSSSAATQHVAPAMAPPPPVSLRCLVHSHWALGIVGTPAALPAQTA